VSEHEPNRAAQNKSQAEGFGNQLANLNRAVALERVGGDFELLQEIAKLFLEHSPELVSEMRTALEAGNAKALEYAAHSFKGSVGNFGAEACYDAAFQLECLARKGDLTAAAGALLHLEREIAILQPALAALGNEVARN
jgi:HPt (histidine-containing phosphotransfer) domain-containing protein